MKNFDVVSFGEILLRYSPKANERLSQCEELRRQIGGAELNVVSALSNVGCSTGIITKIPEDPLGVFVKNSIRSYGVSDDLLIYDHSPNARIGVYYSESGAYPRKPTVIYDRLNSSLYNLQFEDIDSNVFTATKIFHTTGITLALSPLIRDKTIEIIKKFKQSGAKVSFDVNFRANLWSEELARETILKILPYVDILFCSEETFQKTFKQTGTMSEILRGFSKEFDISMIASTKRTVHSPKSHSFSSTLYVKENNVIYSEKPYENIDIVDRIGSGDAYIAGVLYGIIKDEKNYESILRYGNAFSVLKNTIPGDILCSSIKEINDIIATHEGKSSSELNR